MLQVKPNRAIKVLQSLHEQWSGYQDWILILNSIQMLHILFRFGTSCYIS